MSFARQVVWITGASSGIGEALARGFADAGAHVVLSSRRQAELERVRQTLARPDDHLTLPLDLLRPETFDAAVATVQERLGRIDILVNNAGVSQRARALDATAGSERAIMELDYFAPVALTKAVLPSMMAAGRGHVVVVSSVMGYVGTPGRSSYAAAKHALHGYFDCLRAEVWRNGITITLACPGYVRTGIAVNALGPRGQPNAKRDSSLDRGITPERCAAAIVRGVARHKREIYVGREAVGIYLQRFLPSVFARLVRRMTFSIDADE